VTLLGSVAATLRAHGTPFALIGAGDDVDITLHRGDADDPLAGAVRLQPREGGGPLDVVIGRSGWMSGVLERAAESEVDGIHISLPSNYWPGQKPMPSSRMWSANCRDCRRTPLTCG